MTRLIAEFLGTAALLAIVVGSGIMGETLAQGNAAVALLSNSLATGAGLFVLIQCLGPISGAHLNPIVSLTEALWGRMDRKSLVAYCAAQIAGAIAGVWLAHVMFNQEIIQVSAKPRFGWHLWVSEAVATFGLISTIALAGRDHVKSAPMSIAAYITSAYWFTSSTSFANPAATIARSLTNTFCGIAPMGIMPFIVSQLLGSIAAFSLLRRLRRRRP